MPYGHVVELIHTHPQVKWGMVEEDWYTQIMEPVVSYLRSFALVARSEYFTQHPKLLETWLERWNGDGKMAGNWDWYCVHRSMRYPFGLDKGPACRIYCCVVSKGGVFFLRKPIWPWRCSSSAGFWAWSCSWLSFSFSRSSWNLCSESPGFVYGITKGILRGWEGVSSWAFPEID